MFEEASRIYDDEGGQGGLLKANVKVLYFKYHLTGSIAFKTQHTESRKQFIVAAHHLWAITPMTKLPTPGDVLMFHVPRPNLNSGHSFRESKMISLDFNMLLKTCKINACDF